MKKKAKNSKKRKFIFLGIVFALLFGFQIIKAATYKFQGFMWIGNNSYSDRIEGDATIGMISLKGKTVDNQDYGVILSESADGGLTRLLTGDAWMGIGSKNGQFKNFNPDNSNLNSNENKISIETNKGSLGWVRFNQGVPRDNCFGHGDCHPVRWNKKVGTAEGSLEGYLSGWAKFSVGEYKSQYQSGDEPVKWEEITADNSNENLSNSYLDYPEVWVHFKAPFNLTNYTCDLANNQHNYVCVDSEGRLSGFAWSSGADSTSLNANPGFGWIGFNQDIDGQSLAFLSEQDVSVDLSKFCATRLVSASDSACKKNEDVSKSFDFAAYYENSSILISTVGGIENQFRWRCGESSSEEYQYGESVTCDYTQLGAFAPTLEIKDSSTNNWVECLSQALVRISDSQDCWVLVRRADLTSEEDFVDELTLQEGELISAKVIRTCIDSGVPNWTSDGPIFFGGDEAKFGLNPNGTTTMINASIGSTVCTPAKVLTRDSIKWR